MAITVGPLPERNLHAGPWTPLPEFAGGDGTVKPLFVWAALDCPTSWPTMPLERGIISVLGRLSCRLVAPIEAGRPHTAISWEIGHDGRKHLGGAAIHSADGALCAYSEGVWIELRDASVVGART